MKQPYMKSAKKFLDSMRIYVHGGNGGMGFPKYGGTGGKGGDVYVEAVEGKKLIETLKMRTNRRWEADHGENSHRVRILGESGQDLTVPVPVGTAVLNDHGHCLGDLNKPGDKVLVARGGMGGFKDNQWFGQHGEASHVRLNMKLIADVGFVGFPNAGKSTLLRALSRAKPKVASYPFTTIEPHIGIVKFADLRQISFADLPGLIEGAWANLGMGHSFLRHVERTKLLMFVVDINGFRLGPKYQHRSAIETVILLNRELELFKPYLVEKPAVVVVNKMDVVGAHKKYEEFHDQLENIQEISKFFPEEFRPEQFLTFSESFACSAKHDIQSVQVIKERVRVLLDQLADLASGSDEKALMVHEESKSASREEKLRIV